MGEGYGGEREEDGGGGEGGGEAVKKVREKGRMKSEQQLVAWDHVTFGRDQVDIFLQIIQGQETRDKGL